MKNAPCARPARLISAVRIRPGLPTSSLSRSARLAPNVRITDASTACLSPNARNSSLDLSPADLFKTSADQLPHELCRKWPVDRKVQGPRGALITREIIGQLS